MDAAGREKLIGKIKAHPERYVAQEGIALSTAPARTDAGLAARHVVLESFCRFGTASPTPSCPAA